MDFPPSCPTPMADVGNAIFERLALTLDHAMCAKVTGMLLEAVEQTKLGALLDGPEEDLNAMVNHAVKSIDDAALQALRQQIAMSEESNEDMGQIPWVEDERCLRTNDIPVKRDVTVKVWLREPINLPFTAYAWLKSELDEAFLLVGTITPDYHQFSIDLKQGSVRLMISLAERASQGVGDGMATARKMTMAGQIRGRDYEKGSQTTYDTSFRSRIFSWADEEEGGAEVPTTSELKSKFEEVAHRKRVKASSPPDATSDMEAELVALCPTWDPKHWLYQAESSVADFVLSRYLLPTTYALNPVFCSNPANSLIAFRPYDGCHYGVVGCRKSAKTSLRRLSSMLESGTH